MITAEENDQLTKIGPGTMMGNLMRRYWHPVASAAQLEDEPVIEVDLLGEELVLYKDLSGKLGLLARACAHRQTSLAYAIPEEHGIRCAYHGWVWSSQGQCLEQPSEPEGSTYHERVHMAAYPVRQYGGLIFAYMGPGPAPMIPQYNVLDWEHASRETNGTIVPCNWLQVLENLLDPAHIANLHGRYFGYVLDRTDPEEAALFRSRIMPKPIKHLSFDLFDQGMIERHYTVDEQEHSWLVGSPIFFPATAMMGRDNKVGTLIFVVPLDDQRTWFVEHRGRVNSDKSDGPVPAPYHDVPGAAPDGSFKVGTANGQDHMAVVTQGKTTDRRHEHLGAGDAGLIIYRQLLLDQARIVQDRGDPMNVHHGGPRNRRIDLPQVPPEPVSHLA